MACDDPIPPTPENLSHIYLSHSNHDVPAKGTSTYIIDPTFPGKYRVILTRVSQDVELDITDNGSPATVSDNKGQNADEWVDRVMLGGQVHWVHVRSKGKRAFYDITISFNKW